ncbi:MAG: hypothetical protein OXC60_05180 [Litoreibacter sp.]|nr:hypothetical protein [Litoreibacter sp.]MCY4334048.1 hypothetical protein [Litoreibacter sp.]
MKHFFTNFAADESGAVTVDWVVLAAVLIGLCLAVMATVGDGTEDLTSDLDAQMSSQMISTTF